MSRTLRLLAAVLLATLPLLAVAQSEETLQRHVVAVENLRLSVSQLGTDNTASLDALESAASTMRLVSRDTASSTLVAAMDQAFDNARTAIANQSRTDLAVQTAVLRGGFQRALLESSLATGTVTGAQDGFSQLAAEHGFGLETLDALAGSGSLEELLGHYRSSLAADMAERLSTLPDRFSEGRPDAYTALAGVYGASLSLQDAAEAPETLNSDFAALIDAVVNGTAEDVAALTDELSAVLAGLSQQLAPAPATPAAATEPLEAVTPEQPEQPAQAVQSESTDAAEPAPSVTEPVTLTGEPVQPEAAETAVEAAGDEGAAGTAAEPVIDIEAVRAQLLAEQEQQQFDALVSDLGRRGVRGTAGENLARVLQGRGYTSSGQAIAHGLELASRAASAAAEGNQAAARQHLSQLGSQYRAGLSQLASRLDPAADSAILSQLDSLSTFPVVTGSDIQPLLGLLSTIGTAGTDPGRHGLQASVTGLASGWPRLLLVIVTALLAILPLVLLRMAFGGGNRNWTLIGTGLFLLLLPLLLAGLAAIADLIGHFAAVPLLHELASWVNLTGSLQQLALTVIFLLAIICLSAGLYGICRQFGLFGGTGGRSRGKGKSENKTLVDWDEEF